MIRRYLVIPGTRSLCSDPSPMPHPNHWWEPGSPHYKLMQASGLLAMEEPFEWSGDLDGHFGWLPWNWFGSKDHRDWRAGGSAFRYYTSGIDYHNMNVIAHSHGLQVALHAASGTNFRKPVKIRRLLTIGSPVRHELHALVEQARPNIGQWWHVFDPTDKDKVQVAGAIGDGALSTTRIHQKADMNIAIPGVGHSELLKNPAQFKHWFELGLIDFLRH